MEFLRAQPFQKVPGVAESLDWALALIRLHRDAIDERTLEQTSAAILKVREDWDCCARSAPATRRSSPTAPQQRTPAPGADSGPMASGRSARTAADASTANE